MEISINPNPVQWSAPGSGCSTNRWSWDQVLTNTGGTKITLTERTNYQDGVLFAPPAGDNIGIDPGKSFTRPTSVCLSSPEEHTFRTDWSGSDAAGNKIAATGPNVRLLKKP